MTLSILRKILIATSKTTIETHLTLQLYHRFIYTWKEVETVILSGYYHTNLGGEAERRMPRNCKKLFHAKHPTRTLSLQLFRIVTWSTKIIEYPNSKIHSVRRNPTLAGDGKWVSDEVRGQLGRSSSEEGCVYRDGRCAVSSNPSVHDRHYSITVSPTLSSQVKNVYDSYWKSE